MQYVRQIPLRFGSPLVFPPGGLPGIPVGHPLTERMVISGVPIADSMINLVNGQMGTAAATATTNVTFPGMGQVCYFETNTNILFNIPSPADNYALRTYAFVIFNDSTNQANPQYLFNDTAGGQNGFGWAVNGGDKTYSITNASASLDIWNTGGTPSYGATLPLALIGTQSVPYFIIVSWGGGNIAKGILVNLATGQMMPSNNSTVLSVGGAASGQMWVGNRGANSRQWWGGIAACAFSNVYLDWATMFAIAQDPWSIWYPTPSLNTPYVGIATAGVNETNTYSISKFKATKPVPWSQIYKHQDNQPPVIGTETYTIAKFKPQIFNVNFALRTVPAQEWAENNPSFVGKFTPTTVINKSRLLYQNPDFEPPAAETNVNFLAKFNTTNIVNRSALLYQKPDIEPPAAETNVQFVAKFIPSIPRILITLRQEPALDVPTFINSLVMAALEAGDLDFFIAGASAPYNTPVSAILSIDDLGPAGIGAIIGITDEG